jgi:PAS domain S-box-containing protein
MPTPPPFHPDDEVLRILAAIVESSDDAIIAKDLDGVIVSWNRGAERVYGYSAQEAIGRPVSMPAPESHRDEPARIIARIKAGHRVAPHETVRLTKDGRRVDGSLTVSPIKDAAGQLVGASVIARDITERKRAEHALRTSQARWRSIVESAVDSIIVTDSRGRVEAFNQADDRYPEDHRHRARGHRPAPRWAHVPHPPVCRRDGG